MVEIRKYSMHSLILFRIFPIGFLRIHVELYIFICKIILYSVELYRFLYKILLFSV